MKIVIDAAADEQALATLRQRTDCVFECISPPEEKARELDAANASYKHCPAARSC